MTAFPVKALFVSSDGEGGVKTGVTVSSRLFKKSVDRNRIKRILRECYRLQKADLTEKAEQKKVDVHIFILYNGKELPSFEDIYSKVGILLKKINHKLDEL